MNRAEALKTAEEIVDRQAAKITDRNAFSNSTNVLALRVEQILKLADFLWEPEEEPEPETSVFDPPRGLRIPGDEVRYGDENDEDRL